MKLMRSFLLSGLLAVFIMPIFTAAHVSAAPCSPKTQVLGLPTWYQYLPGEQDSTGRCVPQISGCTVAADASRNTCVDASGVDAGRIWLIVLAVMELLLRLAGFIAVGIVVFGGFKYITSQGQPDATKAARQTIINAFIGIAITIIAAVSVNFVAKILQ